MGYKIQRKLKRKMKDYDFAGVSYASVNQEEMERISSELSKLNKHLLKENEKKLKEARKRF